MWDPCRVKIARNCLLSVSLFNITKFCLVNQSESNAFNLTSSPITVRYLFCVVLQVFAQPRQSGYLHLNRPMVFAASLLHFCLWCPPPHPVIRRMPSLVAWCPCMGCKQHLTNVRAEIKGTQELCEAKKRVFPTPFVPNPLLLNFRFHDIPHKGINV